MLLQTSCKLAGRLLAARSGIWAAIPMLTEPLLRRFEANATPLQGGGHSSSAVPANTSPSTDSTRRPLLRLRRDVLSPGGPISTVQEAEVNASEILSANRRLQDGDQKGRHSTSIFVANVFGADFDAH